MLRLILFILAVLALAYGFVWLTEQDGGLLLTINGQDYPLTLTWFVVALLVLVVSILVVAGLLFALARAPFWLGRLSAKRGRARGRDAVTAGLIAVEAGDLRTAERMASQAHRRLANAPLTRLLEAKVAELEGAHGRAREHYERMADRRDTRLAGLHGLYLEAEREGEHDVARHYAAQALEESATAGWAAAALLSHQVAEHDWEGAQRTLSKARDNRLFDKPEARRKRAVILTAAAMDQEDRDPGEARKNALEAHELAPDLVPATVIAGRLLTRAGEIKRAVKVLEEGWRANPHPDIAEAYAHVRPGDSARDRLTRIESLQRMRSTSDVGRLALARAAIDAREWKKARDTLAPVLTTRPTQEALLLMAEIEEAEHGDSGRAREWTRRALVAPRDPAWVADNVILEDWTPVSPVTGELDAVEWKVPMDRERLDNLALTDEDLAPPLPRKETALAAVTDDHVVAAQDERARIVDAELAPTVETVEETDAKTDLAKTPSDVSPVVAGANGETPSALAPTAEPDKSATEASASSEPKPEGTEPVPREQAKVTTEPAAGKPEPAKPKVRAVPPPDDEIVVRQPDDPGVDAQDERQAT